MCTADLAQAPDTAGHAANTGLQSDAGGGQSARSDGTNQQEQH